MYMYMYTYMVYMHIHVHVGIAYTFVIRNTAILKQFNTCPFFLYTQA